MIASVLTAAGPIWSGLLAGEPGGRSGLESVAGIPV